MTTCASASEVAPVTRSIFVGPLRNPLTGAGIGARRDGRPFAFDYLTPCQVDLIVGLRATATPGT